MTRALSTPPVIPPGALADSPQPAIPAAQGLLLRHLHARIHGD
jgi:hypothetical protein